MATTLPLVETFKIETRKNGEISYVTCAILLDGVRTNANFRAKVGEEAIVIDGDTITVSDDQVAAKRAADAHHATTLAGMDAALAADLGRAIAEIDSFLNSKGASDEARAEIHAHYRAHPVQATDTVGVSAATTRFERATDAILRSHGLPIA